MQALAKKYYIKKIFIKYTRKTFLLHFNILYIKVLFRNVISVKIFFTTFDFRIKVYRTIQNISFDFDKLINEFFDSRNVAIINKKNKVEAVLKFKNEYFKTDYFKNIKKNSNNNYEHN